MKDLMTPNRSARDDQTRQNGAGPKNEAAPKDGGPAGRISSLPRKAFGAFLFLLWGVETILWVASTVSLVEHGDAMAAVTAGAALALLVLLGAMEGLEVSVIDRWQKVWPGRPTSQLAGWLAARQLFVALIVTTATLLANRTVIVVPGTSAQITSSFALGAFDITWTGLTVLWFAQIFPKHLGATNPDRYLDRLRGPLFPIVNFVHRVGVSQPGEWTANAVEDWLDWPDSPDQAKAHRPGHEQSLGTIWRELRKPLHHRREGSRQGRPGGP